jgi:ADP-ribosyltransferase exoenzyme
MAANVIDAISGFLERFSPRTFQSDGQAAQYLFNRAKPGRFGGGTDYHRLHADYDEAQQHLRDGDMDAPTQKFVKMMDDSSINLDSELVVSQTMGPEAFGLTPETMNLEDGGLEDFTGRLIADRGYRAVNIGTPLNHGPGKVTMSVAVPKGTKAIIPARSQNDRGMFLDRDQELRITKVRSDGRGGFYVMAVATPRTPGQTPEPIDRGPRGIGLSPQEREARILRGQQLQAKREGVRTDAQINQEEIAKGTQQVKAEQPAQLPPAQGAPNAPGEPPARNEPVVTEALGGPDTQGKGTAEIAQTPPPQAPTPEAPAAPAPDLRRAVREAGIPSPSEGDRRRQWNNAYLGVASGKKNPEDMLRELETDIKRNRGLQEDDLKTGRQDPTLADDIKAQDQLADTIAKEYGLQRRQEPAPVKKAAAPKAAPSKVTPIGQAGGEKRRELPGEAGGREVTSIKSFKATKAQAIQDREERKRRLLTPQPEAPPPVAPKKAAPAKVIPISRAPLTPQQRNQVSDLSDEERRSYQGFRGKGMSHEDALQSAQDAVGTRNAKKAEQANEALAKKAAPAAPEPGAAPDLDKMTKAELIAHANRPDVGARVSTSMTKDQIKNKIREAEKLGPPEPGSRVAQDIQLREAGLNVTVKELQIIADHEGVPRRGRPTNKAKLQEAIRANRAERAASGVAGTRRINTHGGAESTGLTTEQYNALSRYMGGGFGPANRSLRGRARQGDTAADAAVMDELMATSPMTEDKKVFRGLRTGNGIFGPRDQRPKDLTGFEWTDEGFVSTALNESSAADFAKGPIGGEGGVLLRMTVPKGTNALDLRGGALNEDELLLQRGLRMRVTGEGGTRRLPDGSTARILDVEVVPASAARSVEPNAPAAQKLIEAPDRKADFEGAWSNAAPSMPDSAAGRTIKEIRDDVLSGRITPDEGIRRLENDIDLNKGDLAEVEQELRGDLDAKDRSRLTVERAKLRAAIRSEEAVSTLMRAHFRKAPAATPDEIKAKLDDKAVALMEAATPDQVREAGRIAGFGELKGNTKEELLQDLIRKVAGRELESRAAKKAAPKKLAPAPLEPKKATTPGHVDARLLAEGLDMDDDDQKMLAHVQELLDGTDAKRPMSPAAVGRELEIMNNSAGSPSLQRVIHHQITLESIQDQLEERKISLDTPEELRRQLKEAEAVDARLKTKTERWRALAERLKKTRRPSAKKAAPPAPDTKLTPEEKKTTKAAAELLDIPAEKLQAQVVAKRTAAAPPSQGAQNAVDAMKTMTSREEGVAFLKKRTKAELVEIAKAGNISSFGSTATKDRIIGQIVQWTIGRRLDTDAITKNITPSVSKPEPGLPQDTPRILERINAVDADNVPVMSKKEVADLIANTRKADLVEMAKTYNVPSPSSKTAAELRTWIVDASVGNRIDSIATRGFTGSRPTQGPEGKALENLLPAQLAQIESDLGIKRVSLDRADRIAAIRAKQAGNAEGPSVTRSLPASGRKWNWDVIDQDNMTMHGDSASMNLAQKLRKAGREEDAQYVADMRWRISNTQGEHSPDDVEKMVKDLKAMMAAEQDPSLKAAYARALQDIEAPESPAPELPASTPKALRQMMDELNQIPVARRTGHFAGTTKKVSAVDRLAELIRKTETGEADSLGTVESEIRSILRSFHESVDGAFQMWRPETLIGDPEIRTWVRSHYPKT